MNRHLQAIQDFVLQHPQLTNNMKESLDQLLKNAEKDFLFTESKLGQIEKEKLTTAILLEQTIEELGQKRKAQAREAQIEAALEKVRSRSLAMHTSAELKEVIIVVFETLKDLGLVFQTAGIQLFTEGSKDIIQWVASPSLLSAPVLVSLPYAEKDFQESEIIRDNWFAKEKGINIYNKHYSFEEKNKFFQYAGRYNNLTQIPEKAREAQMQAPGYTQSLIAEKHSAIWVDSYSGQTISAEGFDLLKRTAQVFEQAHTRFLDLQKAEAQTREAQIEAALERVRARTMSMQKSEELPETSKVLYEQMKLLGEPAEQLTIGVIGEEDNVVEISATLQGSALEKVYRHSTDEPYLMNKVLKAWKAQQKTLTVELKGEELNAYNRYRNELTNSEMFPTNLTDANQRIVYAAFFSKGLLSIATNEPRPPESLQLLARFASVFDLTYTRFTDLQKAEAQAVRAEQDLIVIKEARRKAEEALTELQATQKQLIQSEKMASLGELTAGIAHEIQNPLNFVNNFSEINTELIKELKEELATGNTQEAIAIAGDIKENEEKINHHGKRADAIVKGMLQHSRSSSGQKELTDINALADEYLRLSYHGLRAKDKTFNAKFDTDFDSSIEKLNIMPQDIGRVILNLINNAFYAVTEKKKQNENGFEPRVVVSTKKLGDKIELRICDNGNGIPQKILDKIFQPFFTTKPTGEGTGLGLSLSYDIITKGHAGELKVETNEGEGSDFIIMLPIA